MKLELEVDNFIAPDFKKEFLGEIQVENFKAVAFRKEFAEILEKISALMLTKNHDYAGDADPLSNLKLCEGAGIPAWKGVCGVRLADKFSRIQNFCAKEALEVKDESIEDTLLDMAVYSMLGMILYRQSKQK
jgi:hypothetical protein